MTRSITRIPRIAVWTGDLSVVNGQNVVTRRVVGNSDAAVFIIFDYPVGGGAAIPAAILSAFKLTFASLTKGFTMVYAVCSRSTAGFLRDMPVLLLSRLGKRVVVHVHGSDFPLLLERRVVGRFARWLYRKCDIIVPSTHLLPLLEKYRFGSLVVCENFGETCHAKPDRGHDAVDGNAEFVVLWNSNVMASKGIAELVAGLRTLRMQGARLKLVVLGHPVGDAECTLDEMRTFIAMLTKEDWIEVVGAVAPDEVREFVAACDAVALPSTYESECQPLAVIQAMLAGRELIVTDTLALRGTVGSYPAMFVERTAEAIASTLGRYLRKEAETVPVTPADVAKAAARFSPDAFDRRMASILKSLHC